MSVPIVMIMTGLTCIIGLVMYAVYVDADPSTVREIQLPNTVIESGSMSFTLMEILGNLPTRPKRRGN